MKTHVIFRDAADGSRFSIQRVEYRNDNGTLDRTFLGMPAVLSYDINGKVELEEHYNNGLRHNKHGPAIVYYKDGNFVREEYWVDGVLLLQLDPGERLEITAKINGRDISVPKERYRLVELLQLLKG